MSREKPVYRRALFTDNTFVSFHFPLNPLPVSSRVIAESHEIFHVLHQIKRIAVNRFGSRLTALFLRSLRNYSHGKMNQSVSSSILPANSRLIGFKEKKSRKCGNRHTMFFFFCTFLFVIINGIDHGSGTRHFSRVWIAFNFYRAVTCSNVLSSDTAIYISWLIEIGYVTVIYQVIKIYKIYKRCVDNSVHRCDMW